MLVKRHGPCLYMHGDQPIVSMCIGNNLQPPGCSHQGITCSHQALVPGTVLLCADGMAMGGVLLQDCWQPDHNRSIPGEPLTSCVSLRSDRCLWFLTAMRSVTGLTVNPTDLRPGLLLSRPWMHMTCRMLALTPQHRCLLDRYMAKQVGTAQ